MTQIVGDLALARLRGWLRDRLPNDLNDLSARRMTEGYGTSNEMYELTAGEGRWVLRHPPAVRNAPSAHAVLREHRLLLALEGTSVPHPTPLAACDDSSVFGSPFFVMEWIDGFSPRDPLPAEHLRATANRYEWGHALVEGLIELEAVDWRAAGLEGFGRPDGFLERQVSRWMGQLAHYRSRDIPGLNEVATSLQQRRPPATPPAVLHGDYGFFNTLFTKSSPSHLAAIVDWESATIGDPLLDLGFLTGVWTPVGEEPVIPGDISHLPGMATRGDLIEAYASATGRPVEHIAYYQALALFKLACIIEGAYFRYRSGQSDNPLHAEFEVVVPALIRRAARFSGVVGV